MFDAVNSCTQMAEVSSEDYLMYTNDASKLILETDIFD